MISAASFAALLLSGVLLHPVHETVCELEWNPESGKVECALRMHVLDEQWIVQEYEEEYSSATKSDWRQLFLQRHVFFDPIRRGKPMRVPQANPIRWVGRKEDGAHVWWFFEAATRDDSPPKELETRLLFDREKTYRHRFIQLGKPGKAAVELTAKKPSAELTW